MIAAASGAVAQTTSTFPGGWIEKDGAGVRARYSTAQILSFVPSLRGTFTFPAPYNTRGVRITDASDCGGADCVNYVGYSYWRNTNAHQNSNDMLIFIGLATNRGGAGPMGGNKKQLSRRKRREDRLEEQRIQREGR